MAAYSSFVGVLGAADAGSKNVKCAGAAKNLYVLAGQYAAGMMTQGYDSEPPPADRPQKLKLANEMLERAEMACWTQAPPEPGTEPPTPPPAVVPAGLSWVWVAGAAALALYVFTRGRS